MPQPRSGNWKTESHPILIGRASKSLRVKAQIAAVERRERCMLAERRRGQE